MSMSFAEHIEKLRSRTAPLVMTDEKFRSLGHDLVDRIADFLSSIRTHPGHAGGIPAGRTRGPIGEPDAAGGGAEAPESLLRDAAALLFEHSLFNGHPRFYGYITSSAAPIGMLAELLAAAVNANVGAWKLSPMATEIEAPGQFDGSRSSSVTRPTAAVCS